MSSEVERTGAPPADDEVIEDEFRTVLATVDRKGRRKWVYVDIPKGFWRRLKKLSAVALIGFYLAAPFLTVGGKPLLRFDIPDRQFIIFGHTFWPQDMPYALLMILIGLVGTILLVSLLGRVFCGWLCPHNVFLEMVYRPIEALLEGPAHRRRRNDQDPSGGVRARKVVKYLLYILISGILANTATALFVDKDAFLYGFLIDPVNHTQAAIFFAIFFSACMFNFAWFREQTCTIVCPYGRLQAALLDSHTLTVAYDPNRGEPRGRRKKDQADDHLGDCIDCYRCVAVCPTGIDIRNGIQLECINCTACIDACDDVMERVGKPHGLIRFSSENNLAGERRQVIRPRTILYAVVLTVLCAIFLIAVLNRQPLDVKRLRDANQMVISVDESGDKVLRRVVGLNIANMSGEAQQALVRLAPGQEGARLEPAPQPIHLAPNEHTEVRVALVVPRSAFSAPVQEFTILAGSDVDPAVFDIRLARPEP